MNALLDIVGLDLDAIALQTEAEAEVKEKSVPSAAKLTFTSQEVELSQEEKDFRTWKSNQIADFKAKISALQLALVGHNQEVKDQQGNIISMYVFTAAILTENSKQKDPTSADYWLVRDVLFAYNADNGALYQISVTSNVGTGLFFLADVYNPHTDKIREMAHNLRLANDKAMFLGSRFAAATKFVVDWNRRLGQAEIDKYLGKISFVQIAQSLKSKEAEKHGQLQGLQEAKNIANRATFADFQAIGPVNGPSTKPEQTTTTTKK